MSEDQQKLAKKLIFDALSMGDMGDLTREHQILRVEGSDKLMTCVGSSCGKEAKWFAVSDAGALRCHEIQ
ncbi:hypothetical protein E2C01_062675 [Portunus trituberculatus]|uniref:Uncharacterized protein n=1 Tax=Portunus trituberculatus TaxID=210409 RepID=A0A5B7HEB8_PORTR|nr:hypothetical protein [Portunus trituberculatus]